MPWQEKDICSRCADRSDMVASDGIFQGGLMRRAPLLTDRVHAVGALVS